MGTRTARGSTSPRLRTRRREVAAAVVAILSHRRLLARGWELLGLAVREFFLPQYETLIRRQARPVVRIAHPLDELIPFLPAYVGPYLGFITLWLESLGRMFRRFGERSIPEIERSIADLCTMYRAAGRIYRRCQTTTIRARPPLLSLRFPLIRLFDPHLHCIPSLHVLIASYTYLSLRRVPGQGHREADDPAARAYRGALLVIRSILLVKQHSLADIGPSLFTLTALFPAYGEKWVAQLVGDLFPGIPGIPGRARARLREAVLSDYRELGECAVPPRRRGPAEGPLPGVEEVVLGFVRRRGTPVARIATQQPPP